MDLSLIIPAYNCQEYISICLSSIYRQKYMDYEIIVVDDGSTDDTGKICDLLAQEHQNTYVIHQENGGVSSARNKGIDLAKGKHVMFVDADDQLLDAHYLDRMMNFQQYDYVAGGYTCRLEKSPGEFHDTFFHMEQMSGQGLEGFPDDFFIRGFFHTCWGKLYRTSLLKENNIRFSKHRVSEDSIFNIAYMQKAKTWVITDLSGYCYMRRDDGKNAIARYVDSDIDTYVQLHRLLLDLPIKKKVVQSTMYAQYLATCLRVVHSKENSENKKRKLRIYWISLL